MDRSQPALPKTGLQSPNLQPVFITLSPDLSALTNLSQTTVSEFSLDVPLATSAHSPISEHASSVLDLVSPAQRPANESPKASDLLDMDFGGSSSAPADKVKPEMATLFSMIDASAAAALQNCYDTIDLTADDDANYESIDLTKESPPVYLGSIRAAIAGTRAAGMSFDSDERVVLKKCVDLRYPVYMVYNMYSQQVAFVNPSQTPYAFVDQLLSLGDGGELSLHCSTPYASNIPENMHFVDIVVYGRLKAFKALNALLATYRVRWHAKNEKFRTIEQSVSSTYSTVQAKQVDSAFMSTFGMSMDAQGLDCAEPAAAVRSKLFTYQKRGLAWMIQRESDQRSMLFWECSENEDASEEIWYNKLTGDVGDAREAQEASVRGGILSDEMGLGKTLQVISLIATNSNKPPGSKSSLPASQRFAAAMRGKRIDMAGPTLIVAPLSVIKTWQDQLNQHLAPGSIKVHLHHGVSRAKGGYEAAVNNLRKSDVVLTTFQTVAQEWAGHDEFSKSSSSKAEASAAKSAGKSDDAEVSIDDEFENPEDMEAESEEEAAESGPLFGVNWFRIVLDEAHMIRTRTTRQSSAACALRGDRRWCLTGTPVQNKLNDLFSLLCFLRVKPLDELKYWARYVSRPIKAGESAGVMVLRQVLQALCLRRSKDSINPDTGEAIVKLPTKTLNKICVKLSIEERAVYNRVELAGQKAFTNLLQSGSALSNMTSILVMLLRMRQCCNHLALLPASILDDKVALDASTIDPIRETLEQLRDSDGSEVCMVCDEQMKEPMILSGCAHYFCRACIAEFVSHRARQTCCPVCDTPIANNSMIDVAVALAAGNHATNSASSSPNRAELAKAISSQTLAKSKPSSKIVALIQDLRAHRVRFAAEQNLRDDQGRAVLRQGHCKSVVFSQWTSMLDLIQATLDVEGFKFTRLDGSMTRQKREGAIDAFNNDASVEIMLISLGSGNLGLNLTAANRLYLCDPWWNPQVENQAIDRVHRVGQTRAVDIVRVVVEGTVEDRIFEMQTKKSMILHDVLSGKVSASKDVQKANRIAMLKEILNVDGQPVGVASSSQSVQSTGANLVRASSPHSSSSQAPVSNVKKRPIENAAVDTTRVMQRPKPAAAAAAAPPPLLPMLPVQSNFYAPFSLSAPPGASSSTVSSNSLQGQMLQQQQLQQVQQQQLKAYMDAQQAAQAAMMLLDDDDE